MILSTGTVLYRTVLKVSGINYFTKLMILWISWIGIGILHRTSFVCASRSDFCAYVEVSTGTSTHPRTRKFRIRKVRKKKSYDDLSECNNRETTGDTKLDDAL